MVKRTVRGVKMSDRKQFNERVVRFFAGLDLGGHPVEVRSARDRFVRGAMCERHDHCLSSSDRWCRVGRDEALALFARIDLQYHSIAEQREAVELVHLLRSWPSTTLRQHAKSASFSLNNRDLVPKPPTGYWPFAEEKPRNQICCAFFVFRAGGDRTATADYMFTAAYHLRNVDVAGPGAAVGWLFGPNKPPFEPGRHPINMSVTPGFKIRLTVVFDLDAPAGAEMTVSLLGEALS